MLASFSVSLTSRQITYRDNHDLTSPEAHHKQRVERDDHQTPPGRVTSDPYPDNVSVYDTNLLGDVRPTNKAPPNDALRTTLVETGGNSKRHKCNALIWAGDLTPNSSDIMEPASYVSSQKRHRASWQA